MPTNLANTRACCLVPQFLLHQKLLLMSGSLLSLTLRVIYIILIMIDDLSLLLVLSAAPKIRCLWSSCQFCGLHSNQTQFGSALKCFQANNGIEFVNHAMADFLSSNGTQLRLLCPYTSPQNGKSERMISTNTNTFRTLLIHASMQPSYLAGAYYNLPIEHSFHTNSIAPLQYIHTSACSATYATLTSVP